MPDTALTRRPHTRSQRTTAEDPTMTEVPAVIRAKATDLTLDEHGVAAPPAGVTDDHEWMWFDPDHGACVWATTADELLGTWWPTYRTATYLDRQKMRIRDAINTRASLIANLVVEADRRGQQVSEETMEQLTLPVNRLAELAGVEWTEPIPLVLVDGVFAPDTDLAPPTAGINPADDTPATIYWLTARTARAYVTSLAQAGWIQLSRRAR